MLWREMACTATCQYGRYLGPSLQTSLMCKAHLPRHRTSAAKTSRFGPTSWYLTDFCGSNRKLPCRELPPAFANCKEYPRSFATNASSPRPTNSRPEHGPSEKPLRGGNGLGDPPFARKRDMDLKAGPYRRGRIFISPREDPKEFVLSCLVVFVMLYTLYHLPRGEYLWERRKRLIRERLLKEYGLTEADLDIIEGEEAPLSDEVALGNPNSNTDSQLSRSDVTD